MKRQKEAKYNRQISLTRQRAFMLSHLTSKGEATESIKTDFSLYQIQVAGFMTIFAKSEHILMKALFGQDLLFILILPMRKETSILPLLQSVEELIPMYADSASVLLDSIPSPR